MTATQLSITGEESLCRTCYLMVLNILKATEDVNDRTLTLQDKVSSAHAFFSSLKRVYRWSLEPTATFSTSSGSISSQKKI